MASVLVDTSVWVDYFRGGQSEAVAILDNLLEEKKVALCGTVEMELLQGVRPGEKDRLMDLLTALNYIETERADFQMAGEMLAALRAKGIQIPTTDGLIASLCVRHQLSLLTLDKHFDHLQHVRKIKH
jgi:hypothetical protein